MVSAITLIAFAATALATAVENTDLTLNVLLKRQETTSGAQYECHADCGKLHTCTYTYTHRTFP